MVKRKPLVAGEEPGFLRLGVDNFYLLQEPRFFLLHRRRLSQHHSHKGMALSSEDDTNNNGELTERFQKLKALHNLMKNIYHAQIPTMIQINGVQAYKTC